MNVHSQTDLLTTLRRNLKRIEENGDDGFLTPAALELKHLLLRRIAQIEAAIDRSSELAAEPSGRTGRSQ